MKMRLWIVLAATATLLVASIYQARAESADEFYRGKQVKVIVSFDTGTDYDQWTRLIIRHFGKHLDGHPSFVVQNMGAAGGILATNHLFNAAPADGTVIGMIGRNLPYFALVQEANARYDPVKFNWIGSPELTNRVCVATDKSGITRGDDLFEKELLVGGAGAGTAVTMTPLLLANALGMKFKLIEGYGSSNAVMLAIERGEVQGICNTLTQFTARPALIRDGKIRILFHTEEAPLTSFPDVPSIYRFAKTEEQKQLMRFVFSSVEFGRPYVMPPGVPAERLAAMRQAFAETLRDPELIAEAEKAKLDMTYRSPEALTELVAKLQETPRDMLDTVLKLVPAGRD
jgi:tripartite-type tricarboxylate transporter receptor subunit TctC